MASAVCIRRRDATESPTVGVADVSQHQRRQRQWAHRVSTETLKLDVRLRVSDRHIDNDGIAPDNREADLAVAANGSAGGLGRLDHDSQPAKARRGIFGNVDLEAIAFLPACRNLDFLALESNPAATAAFRKPVFDVLETAIIVKGPVGRMKPIAGRLLSGIHDDDRVAYDLAGARWPADVRAERTGPTRAPLPPLELVASQRATTPRGHCDDLHAESIGA